MRSSLRVIAIAFLLLVSLSSLNTALAQTPPPGPMRDWIIEDDTIIEDETISLWGDLIVRNGGNLTLINCVVEFNCVFPGQYGILVEESGKIDFKDTEIGSASPNNGFTFEIHGAGLLDGCHCGGMYDRGIDIYSDNVWLESNWIHDNGWVGYGVTVRSCSPTIANNTFTDNYGAIICHDEASGEIYGNTINGSEFGIAYFEQSTARAHNNSLSNNNYAFVVYDESTPTIESNTMLLNNYGIQTYHTTDTTIKNNTFDRNGFAFQGLDTSNSLLADNVIKHSLQDAVVTFDGCHCGLKNNTISGSIEDAIQVQGSSSITATGNTITGNSGYGIIMQEESNGTISGNTIRNNKFGIGCFNTTTVSAANNTIIENTDRGVHIQVIVGGRVELIDNLIKKNGHGVVTLLKGGTILRNNQILENSKRGIWVALGAGPIIDGCTISDSGEHGIYVRDISRPFITDTTIKKSGDYDVWVGNNSYPTFISCDFDTQSIFHNDSGSEVSLGWWVTVEVNDAEGAPVPQANVTIFNSEGATYTAQTDSDGYLSAIPLVELVKTENGTRDMNPFNFTARKGNSEGSTITVVLSNEHVAITLGKAVVMEAPVVIDNTIGTSSTGEPLIINARAIDYIGITNVTLYYWFDTVSGPTSPLNVTMTFIGSTFWETTITVPTDATVIHYNISAKDTSDQWNETGQIDALVIDNDPPAIADNTVRSPFTGEMFTINASVADNIAIDNVTVYYWFDTPSGSTPATNNTLTYSGRTFWEITITVPADATYFHYNIYVRDTNDNWAETGQVNIAVLDDEQDDEDGKGMFGANIMTISILVVVALVAIALVALKKRK